MSWTDLGAVASLTYPQIAGVGPARTVCSSYANGFLVGVACLPTSTHLKELTYATTSTTGDWA